MKIRLSQSTDIPYLAKIADATDLFPSELLPQIAAPFLANPEFNDIWLSCELNNNIVGFCWGVSEKLTDGTWNMLSIAVDPSHQATGVGTALVFQFEAIVRERGARIIIVDTSSLPEFEHARQFYLKNEYTQEARVRDFWNQGNDKIIFWKQLN